jgi:hypothetical protein
MGELRNVYIMLLDNLKAKDHVEIPGLDGKITLEWILGKQ